MNLFLMFFIQERWKIVDDPGGESQLTRVPMRAAPTHSYRSAIIGSTFAARYVATLKMALLAPMPMAKDSRATAVKRGS